VWLGREFYSGRHPMSKGTWDIGVVKIIRREETSRCTSRGREMQENTVEAVAFQVLTPTVRRSSIDNIAT
jgi:hypothetical protein